MKGKGGALMIVVGKKPGMGKERPSSPSLASDEEDDSSMEVGPALKAYEAAKAKGDWKKAAEAFKMAVSSCGDYED
jgi:hypothetical protein